MRYAQRHGFIYRLNQILLNLLSNAIKFSKTDDEIIVTVTDAKLRAGRREGDSSLIDAVQVTVSDEGMGIHEEELELVFDKFVQSSISRTGAGGTGLGLAICKEIIEAHGGTIRAENNARGGASISFVIPLRPPILRAQSQRSYIDKAG